VTASAGVTIATGVARHSDVFAPSWMSHCRGKDQTVLAYAMSSPAMTATFCHRGAHEGTSPHADAQSRSRTPECLASFARSVCGHTWDIYGQMVVSLRLNGITPPASQRF
jgi:hypothetical protein